VRESCRGRGGGQDSTQERRRQLWGLVGFGEAYSMQIDQKDWLKKRGALA
jgi:hypothetical protein